MKKLLVLVLAFGLIFGSLASAEAKKKKNKIRTVTFEYQVPSPGVQPALSVCAIDTANPPCLILPTAASERYFKISVEDASGQNVSGFVSQGDANGNGVNDDAYAPFCGSHATAQAIASPGTDMNVYASGGACADGSPSLMTTGTMTIKFAKKPF